MSKLTPQDITNTCTIASIFSFRMLGLFMILPVFALHAINGAYGTISTMSIGIAIGIYGLTQALLQIPFGIASDRFGRKPLLLFGLILFVIGSLIAATATTIEWIIAGRALQGAGAISSVLLASIADVIPAEVRTRAMALVGVSIGFAFILSLLIGPMLYAWVSMSGIFFITAGLATIGIILSLRLPSHHTQHTEYTVRLSDFKQVIHNTQLLRLDLGIFLLHAMMTALFIPIPILLAQLNLDIDQHWILYLPVMLASVLFMAPLVKIADKHKKIHLIFRVAILLIITAMLTLTLIQPSLWSIAAALVIFFTGFNVLEASLPATTSKLAVPHLRGTVMGVYASHQFLGAFTGGILGGFLYQHYGAHNLFIACAIASALWLFTTIAQRFNTHPHTTDPSTTR